MWENWGEEEIREVYILHLGWRKSQYTSVVYVLYIELQEDFVLGNIPTI